MKFNVLILILFISTPHLAVHLYAEEPVKVTGLSGEERRLAVFLAGIELLETERSITPDEKSAWFEKLKELTGFDAESANLVIDKFKNNPEKWAKVLELASQEVKLKLAKEEIKEKKKSKKEKEATKIEKKESKNE